MQVTYDKIFGHESTSSHLLPSIHSKGSLSTLSIRDRKKFVLKEKNGGKLLGFHGRAGEVLHALGAYFVTTTTPLTPAKKLPAVGGDGGTALDDGAYDGVRKLFVGQAQDGISVVKFVYAKGAEEIIGDEHGNSTLLGFEEVLIVCFYSVGLFLHQNSLYCFVLVCFNRSLYLTIRVSTSRQLKAHMIRYLGVTLRSLPCLGSRLISKRLLPLELKLWGTLRTQRGRLQDRRVPRKSQRAATSVWSSCPFNH